LVAPNLAEQAESTFGASSPYIDSTPYDLGATQPSSPSVVLSERSTGCQVTLSQGQTAPGSICPEVSGSGAIAAGNPGYDTVNVGAASFSGGGSAGGRIAPSGRDYFNLTVRPPALVGNGNFKLMFPLSIPAVISSVFGWRIHPVSNEPRFHSGTDLAAPEGTPVLAAFSGKVAIADFLGGYGLTVVLRHNRDTQETLYGHLSELFVKPGDTVKQGEVIGRVGSTGISTGPHLHFEFRQYSPNEGWVTLDPSQAIEYSLAQFVKDLQNGTIRTAQNNRLEPLEQLKVMLQQAQEQKQAADAKPSSK
jgi:murein DD-endopeptidase MepM/ murein hydrolase activator NlpD